ncbi:unnamed protein product [Cuscuta epithymum]|uniref:SAM domain-containing protein n=1 Tax=Cuscuta epithymum TaxID=186058 RepID=A0AAV0EWU3_9ASTE|nr:unnamed protein product [Cuscuta epithymum]
MENSRSNEKDALDHEQLAEDGWVMVKKQIVTILVPASEQSISANSQESPLQEPPRKSNNSRNTTPVGIHTENRTVVECEKSILVASKHMCVQPQPTLQFQKPSKLRMRSKYPQVSSFRTSFVRKVTQQHLINANGGSMMNKRMKALNIERRLRSAGGLTNWLVSLGLGGHFIKIFRGNNVSKFQLASLTMEKLKDMGSFAVGPRRKLLHAIDCFSHPYCCKHK